ncbi:MAG: sugar ABC transporter substrate-binding protein [Geminicoccaceae bacterium]
MAASSKVLAGSVMALALVAASASAQETRIVVITHGQAVDAFWSVVKNGVDDAAELMGVEVQYQAPQTFDMVAMAQLIDAAVATQPDGLVVSIPDADALGDSIRAAVAAGIPVISMDSGLDVSKELGALLHMGIDEYPSGFAAGEKMKELGKTSGACINMEVGNVALDQRCQGFADALDGNSQVIATSIDPIEIRAGVTGYLMQHPEIDAVLTAGATAFDPTLAAIEEAGLSGQIALGSFDLSPSMLEAIDQGKAVFGIDAQQYLTGYYPVIFLTIYDRYGMVPVNDVLTGPLFVTKDTAKQVIELSAQGYR